jgi:preprotein translocase subunit SecY
VTAAQAFTYLQVTIPAEAILVSPWSFRLYSVIILVAGTMFCMWLGEKITDKGIGNGISMLIMIGIVSRFPASLLGEAQSRGMSGALLFIIEVVALFFVVMGAVMVTQAVRRIPVQYAKQVVGNRVSMSGERQYIPLKLNAAGVMPIIFAQALMFVPGLVAQSLADKSEVAQSIAQAFGDFTTWQYNLLFAFLIIVFTFFYTAISINPTQISDDMKRGGGFVQVLNQEKLLQLSLLIFLIELRFLVHLCWQSLRFYQQLQASSESLVVLLLSSEVLLF